MTTLAITFLTSACVSGALTFCLMRFRRRR